MLAADNCFVVSVGTFDRPFSGLQRSARSVLRRRHRVEVVTALHRDRDLLPDVGQILEVWEQVIRGHREV